MRGQGGMGQGRNAGTYRPVQRGVDFGLPGTPEGGWDHLGFGNLSQHLLRGQQAYTTGIQDSERHHVGEDKSATQYLVPILHLLHRVRYLGKEGEESAALLQLPADEKTERRQADVGRMATACHRKMGEIAGQASYAETARPSSPNHPGFYQTGGVDSRPVCRQQHHRHRCQSAGAPLPGHRQGKAISGTEQGEKGGAGIAGDTPRLPTSHQRYRNDGENGTAGRHAPMGHTRRRTSELRFAILKMTSPRCAAS